MPSPDPQGAARPAAGAAPRAAGSAGTPPLEDAIRGRLEARRLELAEEIRHYPSPIAGCDQQFNWLLEQHDRLRAQLQRLEEICAASPTAEERAARVQAFDPETVPVSAYPHDSVHG